jgi:hypothetical protein
MEFGSARKAENPPDNCRKRLKNHNVVFRPADTESARDAMLIWVSTQGAFGQEPTRRRTTCVPPSDWTRRVAN